MPGILAGAILVFVDVMKELPITVMLRPLGYDTLAIWVWQTAAESLWTSVALPALVIVLAGLIPIKLLLSQGKWKDVGYGRRNLRCGKDNVAVPCWVKLIVQTLPGCEGLVWPDANRQSRRVFLFARPFRVRQDHYLAPHRGTWLSKRRVNCHWRHACIKPHIFYAAGKARRGHRVSGLCSVPAYDCVWKRSFWLVR